MSSKDKDTAGGQGKPVKPEDLKNAEKRGGAPGKDAEGKLFCEHGNFPGSCLRCKRGS